MITTHNNNILSYNKNNNIYNTNNTIFYLNTFNYKKNIYIYNTHYYINKCGWTQLEVGLRRLLTHLGVGWCNSGVASTCPNSTCYFFL